MRPSTMCTAPTPASRASTTPASFGIIPLPTLPEAISARRSRRRHSLIRLVGSRDVAEDPLDVGEEDRLAGAEGGGQAAGDRVGVDVVALAVGAHARPRPPPGRTRTGSPAPRGRCWPPGPRSPGRPRRLDAFSASISPPSSPARPTAGAPARCSWRHDLLVDLPHQDHLDQLHGGRVGHPQALHEAHLEARAGRSTARCRGRRRARSRGSSRPACSSATSRAKDAFSSGVVMAAPPYLMTIVAPANSRM